MADFYTTMDMTETEIFQWRDRARRGDAYELEGAFGDTVFVPKVRGDIDPARAREIDRLNLEWIQRMIDRHKKESIGINEIAQLRKKRGASGGLLNYHG